MAISVLLDESRQCLSKRQMNKRDAKRAIKAMECFTGRMIAYRCGWCGFWHIGHPLGKTKGR